MCLGRIICCNFFTKLTPYTHTQSYFTIILFQIRLAMKKIFAFILVVAAVLTACQGPTGTPVNAADVKVTRTTMESEVNKTVANLSISGMTCAAGCGGKIQQELQAMQGIKTTDLNFEDNRQENIVSVEFDPTIITEKEMIEKVGSIADGMYQVKSVEIVDYKGLQTARTSGDAGVSESDFGRIFQLVNLLQSLSSFIK